jgi:3-methyladenine DNA glycosylase AlkC
MSYLLKDIYSESFFNNFSDVVIEVIPAFDKLQFSKLIFDQNWQSKELKDRMRHTSFVLSHFFPKDFKKTATLIENIIKQLRQQKITESSLEFMFFPDYIEKYGIDHYDVSVKLMEFVTQFTSCEYAVRPFIIKYGDKMITQMHQWSLHENVHVRRLASEGIRPRLPWAIAIPTLKKDPAGILPLLENLKNDPSEYVRRSVANNLNDITKDHPHIVLKIAKQWKGISKETDALIKHASRTLLKQGNKEILKYYGLHDNTKIEVTHFKIKTPKVKIGDYLSFSFSIKNSGNKEKSLRIEYAIHYLLKNGQHYKKVFKISERQIAKNESLHFEKRHSFKLITTRKYYPGQHKISVIINGQELKTGKFELIK